MSTLEARLEKLEKVAGPADPPCFSVEITRQSSHLLTAGEEDTQPARKRRAGHVCGEHCVRVSINRRVKHEPAVHEGTRGDAPALQPALPAPEGNASTEPSRGDAQPGQERVAADRVTDAQPGPPRSPEPVYGPEERPADVVPGGRARDAVVDMERTAPPALVSPLALQMQQEADAKAAALSRDVQSMVPWWLPVAEAQLGICAVPYCGHPALQHRGPRTRLPCICGFRAEQHDPDGIALEVPQYARRVSPCSNYRAIYVDEEDSDRCESPGCACRCWRRWLPMDPRSELMVLQAQIAERDRLIAENDARLARLRAQYEEAERAILRAQGPRDLGATPHGCPVYSDEVSR